MIDPISVATFFMYKSFTEENKIDSIKIMKLSVIAHGYYLASHGLPLLSGGIQISFLGLVVMKQLLYFQGHLRYSPEIVSVENTLHQLTPDGHAKAHIHPLLTSIWDSYGSYKPHHLCALLNLPSQPWYSMQKRTLDSPLEVPDTILQAFFKHENDIFLKENLGYSQ